MSCDAVCAKTALATCGIRGWKYQGAVVVNDHLQSDVRERGRVLGDLKQGEGGVLMVFVCLLHYFVLSRCPVFLWSCIFPSFSVIYFIYSSIIRFWFLHFSVCFSISLFLFPCFFVRVMYLCLIRLILCFSYLFCSLSHYLPFIYSFCLKISRLFIYLFSFSCFYFYIYSFLVSSFLHHYTLYIYSTMNCCHCFFPFYLKFIFLICHCFILRYLWTFVLVTCNNSNTLPSLTF